MSKVWTSEELARECKNCEVASAGRIRSQAETISQLRETIALMSRERSKMREALYAITRIDTRRLKSLLCELVEADIFDGGQISQTISAVEKARQAISAPPRDCDDLEVCIDYDESDEAIREEREAYEVDKADAKRKGEW